MQERCHESGSCVQKNCAILGVHPNHLGTTSVQLRARFQEREPVSDAQQSIWSLSILFGNSGFIVGRQKRNEASFLPVVILSQRSSPSRVRCAAPEKRRALDGCGPL